MKFCRYSWFKRWNECVDGLGGECACCGEIARTMLEIDHIGGNGNIHRKAAGGSVGVYNEIIALGFPRNKFQVLCGNCNKSKMRNSGLCEHLTGPTDRTGATVTRAHEVNAAQPSQIERFVSRLNASCGTTDHKPLAEMMVERAYQEFIGAV